MKITEDERNYFDILKTADFSLVRKAKAHWIECLKKAIESGNSDSIDFAARRIAIITMVEEGENSIPEEKGENK